MDPNLEIHSHVGVDGVLHIEGLLDMAGQDVTVTVSRNEQANDTASPFELERYAAQTTGQAVADRIKAISNLCSGLSVLDGSSFDEIIGYNDIGLPG